MKERPELFPGRNENPKIMQISTFFKPAKKTQQATAPSESLKALNRFFSDHGFQTYTQDGDLFVREDLFYKSGRCITSWLNATNWTRKDARLFVGYDS